MTLVTVRTRDPATGPAAANLVSDLVRVDDVERISIGALSRAEVADQIANLTDASPPKVLVDRVVGLTRGVPFLTEQLIAAGLTETGAVPATVLEPMQARIQALDPDTRRLVQIGSLADGHLTHDLLEQAYRFEATEDGDRFAAAATTAVRAHVLEFDPDEHTYTFAHALLRHAVEATVLPVDRRRWHRTLATLCAAGSLNAAELRLRIATAHHWAQAGAETEAFDAALDAADQCDRLGAVGEMATLLVRALKLWDRVPDASTRAGQDRSSLLCTAVITLEEVTDLKRIVDLLEAELRRSDATDDPIRHLCLRLERDGQVQELGGRGDPTLYEEALAALDVLMSAKAS